MRLRLLHCNANHRRCRQTAWRYSLFELSVAALLLSTAGCSGSVSGGKVVDSGVAQRDSAYASDASGATSDTSTYAGNGSMDASMPTVAQFALLELEADVAATAELTDPDDPALVEVWADITQPDGRTVRVPGFYYVGYAIDNVQQRIDETGERRWKVRFTPLIAGQHEIVVCSRVTGTQRCAATSTVNVEPAAPNAKGVLAVGPTDGKYWRWSHSGESHFMAGINLFAPMFPTWGVIYPNALDAAETHQLYRTLISRLDALIAAGGNAIRLRLDSWWQALEIDPNQASAAGFTGGGVPGFAEGRYHPKVAFVIDQIIERARKANVAVMVTAWNMNSQPDARKYCSYVRDEQRDIELIERRLRYQVARWGYSPTLFAWEYFNETRTDFGVTIGDPAWTEVTSWLRAIDPMSAYRSVTNTYENLEALRDEHLYRLPGTEFLDHATFDSDLNRPFLLSEGGNAALEPTEADTQGIVPHEILWSTLAGHRSGYLAWHVPNQIEPYDLWGPLFTPLATFLAGLNLEQPLWRAAEWTPLRGLGGLQTFGSVGDAELALLWFVRTPASELEDRTAADGNVYQVGRFGAGRWDVQWFDTRSKTLVRVDQLLASDAEGRLQIAVPPGVKRDIAARIQRSASAPARELLHNPSFEQGTGAWSFGQGTTQLLTKDCPRGAACVEISQRSAAPDAPQQDITEALQQAGPGPLLVQAVVRLPTDPGTSAPTGRAQLVIVDDAGTHIYRSSGVWRTRWQVFSELHDVSWSGNLQRASFNVACDATDLTIQVDGCSVRR